MRWHVAAACFEIKADQLRRAIKAGYDPNQPRDERGRWGNGPSKEPPPELAKDPSRQPANEPPKISEERPATAKERFRAVKELAKWAAKLVGRQLGAAVTIADALGVPEWAEEHAPLIRSYLDEPKSLEELQQAVSDPQKGYDVHHIVERASAQQDDLPRSLIDGPDNKVRIPRIKHWEINGWYGTLNKDFGGLSPRDYLRGKSWDERMRIGLRALIDHGVLKP
jgi:hypothetical protein